MATIFSLSGEYVRRMQMKLWWKRKAEGVKKCNPMKKTLLAILIMNISLPLIGQTFGNSINFDGIDNFAFVPHHPSLNPLDGSWTILLWIKAPDIIQEGPLVRKRHPMGGYNQYNLGIGDNDPHYIDPGKRIYTNYIDSAGVSERSGYTEDEFVDGNWHHLAFVADKATDSAYIYIDGIKQNFIIKYNYGIWPDVGNADSLLIGRNNSGFHYYNGEMDELSIWERALPLARIQTIMLDTLSNAYYNSTDSGLVAYYRFDAYEDLGVGNEGIDDIRDLSFYSNHGDAEGSPTLTPSGVLTAIDDHPVVAEFSIFPNPASTQFTVRILNAGQSDLDFSGGGVLIELYDLVGKKVAVLFNGKPNSVQLEFDIRYLPPGIYYCRISNGNYSLTKRIMLIGD